MRRRFDLIPAVYAIMVSAGHVLMLRRLGTGYGDGQLCLPAGHIEHGEDAVEALRRELVEELGIVVQRDDCELAVVAHRAAEFAGDVESLDMVFRLTCWEGIPRLREPEKCSELLWCDPANLPSDTLPHVKTILDAASDGLRLITIGWGTRQPLGERVRPAIKHPAAASQDSRA